MIKQFFSSAFNYIKTHLVVFIYFTFFVLATLPTMISFIGGLGVAYKIGVLILFAVAIAIVGFKRKIRLKLGPILISFTILLTYIVYYIVIPRYFTFVTPKYSYSPDIFVTIYHDNSMILNSIIRAFNVFFFVVMFVFVAPQFNLRRNDLSCFSYLILGFLGVICIVSLPELIRAVKNSSEFVSVLKNKNTIGLYLMAGVFLSFFNYAIGENRIIKIISICLGFFYLAYVTLSKSSTAAILSAFITIISIIYIGFDIKFISKKVKIILLVLINVSIIFIAVTPFIPFMANTAIGKYLSSVYAKIGALKNSSFLKLFTGRGTFWAFGGYIVRPQYLMLGYGMSLIEEITYMSNISYFSTRVLTNTYLTILDGFGLIGLLLFAALVVFLFIVYYKGSNKVSEWLFIMILAYLLYGMFESVYLFDSFSGSLLVTPILVVPAVYLYKEVIFRKVKVKENEQAKI